MSGYDWLMSETTLGVSPRETWRSGFRTAQTLLPLFPEAKETQVHLEPALTFKNDFRVDLEISKTLETFGEENVLTYFSWY